MITPKNEKQITIYGTASFSFLNERDKGFGEPGEYKVTLIVPRAKSGELVREINEVICEELINQGKIPAHDSDRAFLMAKTKKPYTVRGEEVHFKAHSQYKPVLWDRDQNKLDEKINVWKGSTMWANCKASGYTKSIGSGATLLLGSVQIDHLVEGTGTKSDTCPFPKRAGSALPAPEKAVAL